MITVMSVQDTLSRLTVLTGGMFGQSVFVNEAAIFYFATGVRTWESLMSLLFVPLCLVTVGKPAKSGMHPFMLYQQPF